MQTLKLEKCPDTGCPTCKNYNLAQRRIGNRSVYDLDQMIAIATEVQEERCPPDTSMLMPLLRPARIKDKQINF